MSSSSPATNPTTNAAQTANAASNQTTGTTSPSVAGAAQPAAKSYASAATKKSASPPAIASSTPQVAVGSAQHGKTGSVNGKSQIQPAVPAVGAPPIANGAPAHGRKPSSMTISAAGTSGPMANGSSNRPNISFGSLNAGGSPAIANSVPQAPQTTTPNPRITSPATSPSPIPQPPASGGRPPASLQGQGNGLSFGSMGGENGGQSAQHLRRESSQSAHSDMSNPAVNRNFVPQAGRGRGYNQGYNAPSPGPQFRQLPNQMRGPMPGQFQGQGGPMGSPYRQNRSPAMTPATMQQQAQFANQPQMPHGGYPGYPHQFQPNVINKSPTFSKKFVSTSRPVDTQATSRHPSHITPTSASTSTTLSSSQLQHTFSSKLSPAPNIAPDSGGFEDFLTQLKAQGFYGMQPQHLDPTQFNPYYQPGPYMHPGMPYQPGAPPSPRPMNHAPHASQSFIPGQYGAPHAQSMSRTNSQVSERPPSTMANPQTPSMAAASHVSHTPTQSSSSPAPSSSNFTIPARTKSKGIVIKNPDGEVVTFEKKSSSPAPGPSKSPIVVSSTPTPPPRVPSANSQHGRTDSISQKTAEEKKQEFQEQFQKQLAEERRRKDEEEKSAREKKEKEEAEAKAAKEKAEAEEKAAKEREAAEAAAKEEAEKKAKEEAEKKAKEEEEKKAKEAEEEAAKKAKEEEAERLRKEEDERLEREIAEMEAAERAEEEREKAFQEKRKREKEEAAAKAAEVAAKADDEMKRLEREAEERELAKERGEKKEQTEEEKAEAAKLFASLKKPAFGPAATATEPETSMPPPAQPASKAAAAKPKPAALKLETRKPIEPPAPTPGMQALKSARFLRVQADDLKYPEGIKSPNPALNQGRGAKGFKYDKDFLLQFQEVFKEKPSVDWDNKVRETVGDGTDSARPGSARTPSGMGGRSNSRTMVPSGLGPPMGSFSSGPRTLPPGTTSDVRFAMSNAAMGSRSSSSNPLANFGGRQGSFPMGGGIGGRSASSYAPPASNSPRSGSGRKGGQSRRGKRDDEKDAKQMPLTANQELKPLVRSSTGWVPTSLTQPAAAAVTNPGNLTPDVVQRKVKAALNKMTPEKFDRISDQILEIAKQSENETDGRTLRQVIQLTFEKACDEAHWASMYAKFCKRMLETMSPAIKDENVRDKNGNPVLGGNLFRKYLLNRCQEDFEQGWEANLPMTKKEGEGEEAAMLSDEYYVAAAAKRKGLGLIQFIGELYKLGMLTVRIMHECVMRLLNFEGVPDESNIESLVKLLRTVGATMEANEAGSQMIRAYFERIEKVKDTPGLPSRMHFMLLDLVDLRRCGWKSKDDAKGPKTIQEIHEEAMAAQQQAELEKMRNPPRGGRPTMGRGDARSFSGGGAMPPPDYKHNTLGMDDLRKLSKNASGRTSSSGPGTFGPSSLFAGRSGSGRRNLGPGGGLNRTGDDSGNSSRTGTPPVKEKDNATHHVNSFSALAALEGGDEGANEAASPEPSKVQPATTEKKEGAEAPATGS
ncbi:hypothetical protein SLS57_007147 [Botryosphaeria dothidea]